MENRTINIDELLELGNQALLNNEVNKALEYYFQIIESDKDNFQAYYNIGLIYAHFKKDLDRSIKYLKKAVRFNQNYPEAFNNLGLVHELKRHYSKAILYYDKALAINPDFVLVLNNKGNSLAKMKLFKEAEKCYLHAVELQSNFPDLHYNLACLYTQMKSYDSATKHLERCLEIDIRLIQDIEIDDDFKALRDKESYLNLLKKYKK